MKTIGLSNYYRAVASNDEWEAYKESSVSTDMLVKGFSSIFKEDKSMTIMISERVSKSRNLENTFQKRMLYGLKTRKLIAYGHAMPRRAEDNIVQIPNDVWLNDPAIKWEKNIVKGQGLEFINVGISYGPTPAIQSNTPIKITPTKKQVRPTVKPEILEAYSALRDAGKIDFSGPQTALLGPICDWLANQYPDRENEFKALDSSTIRKTITKPFNVDRSKHA